MQCFEGEQQYFEYDAIFHRQPMQLEIFLYCITTLLRLKII